MLFTARKILAERRNMQGVCRRILNSVNLRDNEVSGKTGI
jgi:hypothetical protein